MKLPIPHEALTQHVIALGKTRSGKSAKLRLIVEWLLKNSRPACIIDPKGDWWGLKSSADGKSAGYPVVIFGGAHADVPINAHAGAHVAELVATGNRPCIIDLKGWMPSARTRFFIDFASTLFKLTRGERYLVIDEVHNFCPKGKILSVEAGEAIHWANRLASEGQGLGLILLAASQRPQKVHNDFLTSCETLIACRVIHKADRDAIKDWIDGCGDPEQGTVLLNSIASMPRTDAWAWSPEIDFGPKQITFPLFGTYDSFKPQKARASRLKGWAAVNLDEVRSKLAAVVKEAEENDPTRLRKENAALRSQVARLEKDKKRADEKPTTAAKPLVDKSAAKESAVAIARLQRALEDVMKFIVQINARDFAAKAGESVDQAALEKAIAAAVGQAMKLIESAQASRNRELLDLKKQSGMLIERLNKLRQDTAVRIAVDATHNEPFTVAAKASAPKQRPRAPTPAADSNGSIPPAQLRLLNALAWLEHKGIHPAQKNTLAAVTGVSPTSGGYFNNLGALRSAGLIDYPTPGAVGFTDAGRTTAQAPDDDGREMFECWLDIVPPAQQKILRALHAKHPEMISKNDLAREVGVSETSGGYFNNLGSLRTLGAIDYPQKGFVALTEYVMP